MFGFTISKKLILKLMIDAQCLRKRRKGFHGIDRHLSVLRILKKRFFLLRMSTIEKRMAEVWEENKDKLFVIDPKENFKRGPRD